jgi:hypothetical protein
MIIIIGRISEAYLALPVRSLFINLANLIDYYGPRRRFSYSAGGGVD